MEVKEPNREYSTVILLNGYVVKLTSVFYTHRLVVFLFWVRLIFAVLMVIQRLIVGQNAENSF